MAHILSQAKIDYVRNVSRNLPLSVFNDVSNIEFSCIAVGLLTTSGKVVLKWYVFKEQV